MIDHLVFWLCYYVFGALISLSIHRIYDPRFYAELFTLLPPDMLLVYFNLYILAPVFLLKRKYPIYFLTLLLAMSAISALNIWLHHLYTLAGSSFFAANSTITIPNMAVQLLNCIYLVGLTTGLKFYRDWTEQQRQLREKEKQQIALELSFLKAQVHPHFFFNTLNNLYSLTLQKSDLAPEVVLKLSSLMSYMLYESGAPYMPLDKEIANLENYIALERLRFGNRLTLSFEKEGLSQNHIQIPPLILLTFVENSFKHGMSQTVGEGRIDISLKADQNDLFFRVDNSVGDLVAPHTGGFSNPSSANGLGLHNVTRRLDLLYGSRYRLDKTETANHFHITLKIPLT
jgi:two-component system, LytTR family, sensor kinase